MKYNGWTNYETWAVNLWLDNDEGSVRYLEERASEIVEQHTDGDGVDKNAAISEMANELEAMHKENTPETTGVYADLLNAALDEVDWYEIAEHHINAAVETMAD